MGLGLQPYSSHVIFLSWLTRNLRPGGAGPKSSGAWPCSRAGDFSGQMVSRAAQEGGKVSEGCITLQSELVAEGEKPYCGHELP